MACKAAMPILRPVITDSKQCLLIPGHIIPRDMTMEVDIMIGILRTGIGMMTSGAWNGVWIDSNTLFDKVLEVAI
jgi:hypothetical protein